MSVLVLDGQITQGEVYTLPLPHSSSGFVILSDGSSAKSSVIQNNESGQPVYTYTPEEGFTGTDEIVLVSSDTTGAPPPKGECNKQGGKKQGPPPTQGEVRQRLIKIHMNVTEAAAS